MKKKGFTLVELLAVIAILAILVIIALPNVMGMFNQAKENSFTTEVKEIFKQAEQQWISDSMMNTATITYYRVGGSSDAVSDSTPSNAKAIKLTGRTQLDYYIIIDKAGKVTDYYATDGSYQYSYKGSGLEVENIGDVSKIVANDKYLVTDTTTGAKTLKTASSGTLENNKVYQVSSLDKSKHIELKIETTGVKIQ